MSELPENCFVCFRRCLMKRFDDAYQVECSVCGDYTIDGTLSASIKLINRERAILSAKIRNNNLNGRPVELHTGNYKEIIAEARYPRNPIEAIEQLILYLYRNTEQFGQSLEIEPTRDYSIFYLNNPEEYLYIREKASELGLIDLGKTTVHQSLSLEGWKEAIELDSKSAKPHQAFVAMWFNNEMKNAWENGFQQALTETGYQPVRIDNVEHNDDVNDRIIAEIRRSGLLVADFTENRGGVYYEAGFAHGLGLPVIYTCRKDHFDGVHFDTNHYNYIIWESVEELKDKLINRINATVPLIK